MTAEGTIVQALAQASPPGDPDASLSYNMGRVAGLCILVILVAAVVHRLFKKRK